MKNWILIGLIALGGLSVAGAEEVAKPRLAPVETKGVRFVDGRVKVTRSWVYKEADGSARIKLDTVCEAPVKIGFYHYKDRNEVKPGALKVFECQTETHGGSPLKVNVWGNLSIGLVDGVNGYHEELIFAGSYSITDSPKPMNGSFAMFTTKDMNLGSGTLLLPAPFQGAEPTEDQNFFAVTLSYER
jgi:hypothetical protein